MSLEILEAKEAIREVIDKAYQADGFIFGSPVQYAGMSGNLKGFMDRLFFSEFQGNQKQGFLSETGSGSSFCPPCGDNHRVLSTA